MYFDNCNLQDISTDAGRKFIKNLSNLLESLNPPLIDRERLEIDCKVDNKDEYIEIFIPHKTKEFLDLSIYFDEIEITVQLGHSSFRFQEYRDDNQRIDDVISLILKIMQITIEVNTFYKGKELVKIQPYFLSESGKKEPLQCSYWNLLTLINPFIKARKIVEKGSFFTENINL